ncbi:glycosyltransferase family 4 protein [Gilvimarinus sp. 1_MG-2023]|uniref:glycosyltransferase family 4 protein n=1 Tax=Gilvimarinus sp. 1_MG-2023 TaxID=3062638 RepID=UPI0026E27AFF|nr:glycosyltransferase family 1 protein [Gilvimarinus sp. 1_MG-2023]MDO6746284.1 glycosyltransferase family 1 protein [Gilvimarinus sp. 1_MG-2023]
MSAEQQNKRRIFIECTHTYLAGGSGGIRRVARSLSNVHTEASTEEVQLLPLVWAGRRFLSPLKPLNESPHPLMALARFAGLITRSISVAAHWPLLAPLREPVKSALHKLCQWLRGEWRTSQEKTDANQSSEQSPEQGQGGSNLFYRVFGLLMWPLGFLSVKPVHFRRGDIIVLVDSTWNAPAMLETLFDASEHEGIQVGAMLHDLFPLTLPHMCQASTVAGYTGWFQQVIKGVDFFITNSAATTQALEAYLQESGPESARRLPAGNFRLGAEVPQSTGLSEANSLQSLPGFVVLAVGTIEPRKNYQVILEALDLLWDKHNVTLVIVGRPGWANEEVMARLHEHPHNGLRLQHFDNASDATLTECYQRADALVCASWAEGFGLPVVEGMRHGAPVLASDIEAFREVGGDACRYFAPDQPEMLASELERLIRPWQAGTPVRQDKCNLAVNWHESAVQFRQEVLRLADAASSSTAKVSVAARSQQ